ncbi:adenylate kinase family enzyme [Arthrobacter woluwensis]|uniref:adenylate kinase n=1 Tax=Arthrobacter woluwensis TaxID=156980 RepID=UPI00277FB298|nr:adenylate kinase [Arthrobacter woluwensis]MDQ0710011.1 adenylate kinase family enzyme [Arthrobacter woluwensis]
MSRASVDFPLPRRILIYGVAGTGKSTAAARLSRITGIPWHSSDDEIGWLPASEAPWANRTDEDMRAIAEDIVACDEWILDSAYRQFRDAALARVELVVGLDYSRLFSFGRLVRRTFLRVKDRTPACNGNIETLRQTFSNDSILLWHFRSFPGKRARIHAWADDPSAPPVLVFRKAAELDRWLEAQAAPSSRRPETHDGERAPSYDGR